MSADWEALFERAAEFEVDRAAVRAALADRRGDDATADCDAGSADER